MSTPAATAGLLLAAGAGTRYGRPKGLVIADDGTPWVASRCQALLDGGCSPVLVVVGAAGRDVAALVPRSSRVVEAGRWWEGMGASLRAALAATACLDPAPHAVLVCLVDTPGVGAAVVARLLAGAAPCVLARAGYRGVPGHPVLLGRDHWDGVALAATGDRGARDYLRTHPVELVECGDVGDGRDVDEPARPPTDDIGSSR